MKPLPTAFLERMQNLLGDEYASFLACYDQPHHTGLRVNTLKISPQDFISLSPFNLSPVPWCASGFEIADANDETRPGKHPHHAAGLYYLQEPSAMAVAEITAPQPGERILDIAAAPGGKSTHLAALMHDRGLLWANEIRTKRIPPLVHNLTRCGARNLIVSNEPPERLADRLPGYFDAVVVDAPCSGEGMFRKEPDLRAEWDAAQIPVYAEHQRQIIRFAARLVRPGGRLIYSTCTFNREENEQIIENFLRDREDYQRDELPALPGLVPGLDDRSDRALNGAARLWPHLSPGEGHFLARLRRVDGDAPHYESISNAPLPKQSLQFIQNFFDGSQFAERFSLRGETVYAIPQDVPATTGLRINQIGFQVGMLKKDRFEPAHALALTLRADDFPRTFNMACDDARVAAYLRGETLSANGADGWLLVCVDGFPLGWGKRVKGVIKNHLPPGLRA